MTTETRLRELLAATTPEPPWIRKWASLDVHGITGDGVLERQENIDLAVAAVNSLPKLLAVVEAARRSTDLAIDENRVVLRAALAALDEGERGAK